MSIFAYQKSPTNSSIRIVTILALSLLATGGCSRNQINKSSVLLANEPSEIELSETDVSEMGVKIIQDQDTFADSSLAVATLGYLINPNLVVSDEDEVAFAKRIPRGSSKAQLDSDEFQRHPTPEPLMALKTKFSDILFLEIFPGALPDKNEHKPHILRHSGRDYTVYYSYPKGLLLAVQKTIDGKYMEQNRIQAGAGPMVNRVVPDDISMTAVRVPHPENKGDLARPTQPGLYKLGPMEHRNPEDAFGEYRWQLIPTQLSKNASYFIHTRPNSERRFRGYQACTASCSGKTSCMVECDKRFPRLLATSHGCIRVDPRDRNELRDVDFLKQGRVTLIRLYTEMPPPPPPNRKLFTN